MAEAFICDAVRTPIGRYGGALAAVRADDLAAAPIAALKARNPDVDWADGRRRDLRLRQSGRRGQSQRRAHGGAAGGAADLRSRRDRQPAVRLRHGRGRPRPRGRSSAGEGDLLIAGGVESMSRAPFVMPKAESAFARANAVYDTTIGWRFVNPAMKARYGDAIRCRRRRDNVAARIRRLARRSGRVRAAQPAALGARRRRAGVFREEIAPVAIPQAQGRAARRRPRRASAAGHDGGAARQAEAAQRPRQDGDGGQRLRRQRRRRGADRRLRGGGARATA